MMSPEMMQRMEQMHQRMQKLLQARVRPYYIYQADMVFGTEHFRTTVEKGLEIIKALRNSYPADPRYKSLYEQIRDLASKYGYQK